MNLLVATPLLMALAAPVQAQAVSDDAGAPAAVSNASGDAPAGALTLDTPILVLVENPRAKAVLDKDMPGLTSDENYNKFKAKSLRELQPLTGGQLTDEIMAKVGSDLAAIGDDADDDRAENAGR